MTRYIDADKLKESMKKEVVHHVCTNTLYNTIMAVIDGQPTADVVEVTDKSMESLVKGLEILGDTKEPADMVEVVRCKDCKHRTELPYVDKDTHEPIYDCGYNISAIWGEENGYCNHGERRE